MTVLQTTLLNLYLPHCLNASMPTPSNDLPHHLSVVTNKKHQKSPTTPRGDNHLNDQINAKIEKGITELQH
jgi:hypothetical protein